MGLGKVVGKLTDTVSNLTLGILHSRPVQGVLKGTFRGISSSVEPQRKFGKQEKKQSVQLLKKKHIRI